MARNRKNNRTLRNNPHRVRITSIPWVEAPALGQGRTLNLWLPQCQYCRWIGTPRKTWRMALSAAKKHRDAAAQGFYSTILERHLIQTHKIRVALTGRQAGIDYLQLTCDKCAPDGISDLTALTNPQPGETEVLAGRMQARHLWAMHHKELAELAKKI